MSWFDPFSGAVAAAAVPPAMSSMSDPAGALAAFVQGLALCASLIVAIGAQNLFVLRQGLQRRHVGPVVALCAACDALLFIAGTAGMAQAVAQTPALARALAGAGAAFLLLYGARAMRRALWPRPGDGAADAAAVATAGRLSDAGPALGAVLAQCAAFTLLNPHVWLDCVLLVGGAGARLPATAQPWFVTGGALASLLWFTLLGFGARWMAPWFRHPQAWRWLDGVVALVMWQLAWGLLRDAL
ncbi:MAG: hypothetical protein RIQ53_2060 [Pseudomonadota bacterium]|jgi:L-lysine exporter family protein LysE/ArgO